MGCTQSKDQVLHESHVATKSVGMISVKDDKKLADQMPHAQMFKHVTNESQGHEPNPRKDQLEAMKEHESEDEPFFSADEEGVSQS